MEMTSFDLHKIMIRAYQDSNVTSALVELIYDYFNNTAGIAKIKYDDIYKFIEVNTNNICDPIKVANDIRQIHASFVVNTIRTTELEYLLSKDSNFETIKNMDDSDLMYMAAPTVTILNITPVNYNGSVFRINLIN